MDPSRKSKKGQVSVELMLIIGIVLVLVLPIILFVFTFVQYENEEDFSVSQASIVASRLEHSINMVGASGPESSIKTEVQIPPLFKGMNTSGDELILHLFIAAGPLDIVKVTDFEIESEGLENVYAPGSYNFEITSLNETHVRLKLLS